ncbi:DUF2878 domain-containing protein [Colwellia echini]|nr:DUF2878 domain-containing protein [Colwellia echini]
MLINIIGFNASWFGLILLGQIFIPFTLFWLGLHLHRSQFIAAEIKLIVSITLIGIVVDTSLKLAGVLIFPNVFLIPLWLITLWSAFAATVAHSLQFLGRSKVLQLIIGFIFPPLSYIGGASLSSVEFGYNLTITYIILGSVWALLMVLFFVLKNVFYAKVNCHE